MQASKKAKGQRNSVTVTLLSLLLAYITDVIESLIGKYISVLGISTLIRISTVRKYINTDPISAYRATALLSKEDLG